MKLRAPASRTTLLLTPNNHAKQRDASQQTGAENDPQPTGNPPPSDKGGAYTGSSSTDERTTGRV
ncbi:MAG TPA: hypothetical protein VFU37_10795 [Pyrinomonadaceae bacterium]|nr:hypothetical protein [Pyrinomonadaceae bacterium]